MQAPSSFRERLTPAATEWWRSHGLFAIAVVGVVVTAAFVVRPVLDSGYTSDDVVNFQIPMEAKADGTDYWEYVADQTGDWIDSVGRFFPASIAETALIFRVFSSRAAYKAFQFGVVLANLGLFAWLVWRLARDRWLALLATLLTVSAMQFRFFHDAVLQFNGQQQIVLGCVLSALLLVEAAVRLRRWWLLAPMVALWLVALMTYETAFLAVPAFGALVWKGPSTRRWRLGIAAAVLVPVLSLGALTMYFRSQVVVTHGAYTTDLSPTKVAPTFVEQAVASLPLSYAAFNVPGSPPDVPDRVEPVLSAWDLRLPLDPFVAVVTSAAAALIALNVRKPERRAALGLGVIAIAIWLLPAMLMATTPRWQMQLRLGLGYITSYAGYFGVAILGALAFAWVLPRTIDRRPWRLLAIGSLVAGTVFTTQATADNNDRVAHMFAGSRVMQDAFQRAIEHGIFEGMAGESVASPAVQWVTRPFVLWHGGPDVSIQNDPDTADWRLEHGWALARAGRPEPPPASGHAWVQLASEDGAQIRLYVEDERLQADDATFRAVIEDRTLAPGEFGIAGRAPGWVLLHISPKGPAPPGSIATLVLR